MWLTSLPLGGVHFTEFLLMDYLSHQKRLLPLIATTYALRIGMNHTKDVLRDIQRGLVTGTLSEADEEVKKRELFLLAGGYKAVSTWHRSETLQICRECCGGQGFAAENRIGVFKSDAEIDLTYEGDNTILMQVRTCRFALFVCVRHLWF
jgi:acyl-CoA oxidase